jgi:hypothetical protein
MYHIMYVCVAFFLFSFSFLKWCVALVREVSPGQSVDKGELKETHCLASNSPGPLRLWRPRRDVDDKIKCLMTSRSV